MTSAIENHPGRLFCPGVAGVGAETVRPGACGGGGGLGRAIGGTGVPTEMVRGGCDIGAVGTFISACAGGCITGVGPVGVTGKAGVEGEMTGGGGGPGGVLPATTGETGGACGCACRGGWLRYV